MPIKNEHKILHLRAGSTGGSGDDWVAVLAGALGVPANEVDSYFAPGLKDLIGMEGNTTFRISATSEIKPALGGILDKLKSTPMAKLARGARALTGTVQGVADGEATRATAASLGFPPNVRYQTDLSYIPAWESTSPVKLESLTFKFTMGMAGVWDARREVYNPVVALAAANLPWKDTNSNALRGPLPTQEYVIGKVIGGLLDAANTNMGEGGGGIDEGSSAFHFEEQLSGAMQAAEQAAFEMYYSEGWTGIWSATLGRIQLPDFYIKGTSYSFSNETDENGYPIAGEVSWNELSSIRVAHRGLPLFRLYGEDE